MCQRCAQDYCGGVVLLTRPHDQRFVICPFRVVGHHRVTLLGKLLKLCRCYGGVVAHDCLHLVTYGVACGVHGEHGVTYLQCFVRVALVSLMLHQCLIDVLLVRILLFQVQQPLFLFPGIVTEPLAVLTEQTDFLLQRHIGALQLFAQQPASRTDCRLLTLDCRLLC